MTSEQIEREKARKKAYRAANAESIRAKRAEWRLQNAERVKKSDAEYRERTRDAARKYSAAYSQTHRAEIAERGRRYREANPEKTAKRKREYYEANRDRVNAYQREWARGRGKTSPKPLSDEQRLKINARNAAYRARKRHQTPADADFDKIVEFYSMAAFMTKLTGVKYEVDHVVPISKGGRHHQDNLVVMTKKLNRAKSNHDWPSLRWFIER